MQQEQEQEQQTSLNRTLTNGSKEHSLKILVTGASGFIGSRVVSRLFSDSSFQSNKHEIICMTRNVESLAGHFNEEVKIIKADASNYLELLKAMTGIDMAFYLIHSMEGSSKDWKKFAEKDRIAAENFAQAATECGAKRIIYLGGLNNEKDTDSLSGHMRSRKQVGEILKTSTAKVTIFRAAVILGQGGGSFQMLQYLVERLPIMVCPKWVLTKSQPIAVDDVVSYLIKAIYVPDTQGRSFDIGGPDVLSYMDMMKRYGKMIDKSIKIIIIPFLTPRLSSYWVDLITPLKASLARPLIDSLKHEATVKDDTIKDIIPLKLKSFEESIKAAKQEQIRKSRFGKKERTSHSLNNRILLISLFAMSAIGSTYYLLDSRPEIFYANWLVLSALWYFGIAFSVYFIIKGARLGAMIAGIIGWITLTFWLTDNIYTVSGHSVIASSPGIVMTIRNFIGVVIAIFVVAASHNIFHKIRIHDL
ncbi:MAG TPA: NAD(P)H-binding protein [Nitrososphaeraceae archaeon]|nr:NAD(P)H-binding protein [Nitrososphaeraceae archaeon]